MYLRLSRTLIIHMYCAPTGASHCEVHVSSYTESEQQYKDTLVPISKGCTLQSTTVGLLTPIETQHLDTWKWSSIVIQLLQSYVGDKHTYKAFPTHFMYIHVQMSQMCGYDQQGIVMLCVGERQHRYLNSQHIMFIPTSNKTNSLTWKSLSAIYSTYCVSHLQV